MFPNFLKEVAVSNQRLQKRVLSSLKSRQFCLWSRENPRKSMMHLPSLRYRLCYKSSFYTWWLNYWNTAFSWCLLVNVTRSLCYSWIWSTSSDIFAKPDKQQSHHDREVSDRNDLLTNDDQQMASSLRYWKINFNLLSWFIIFTCLLTFYRIAFSLNITFINKCKQFHVSTFTSTYLRSSRWDRRKIPRPPYPPSLPLAFPA